MLRQFQPGASLTASVTDPDAVTNADALGAIAATICDMASGTGGQRR